jgi:predicted Zn-dependent protease
MKKLRIIAAAMVIAYPVHAVDLPDLGEVSRVALSESKEDQVGREIMHEIRDSSDFLDDPVTVDYLNALGEQLAAVSPDPSRHFEFFVIQDPTINAFALPGGYIGVHTGLIDAVRNESELAGVLSHEIGHVVQKHIARMVDAQKTSGLISMLALAVAILAARSDSQVSQAAIVGSQAASVQSQLNFTRGNEREADRVGLQIMSASGFSPQAMATFFQRLQSESRLDDSNAPAYLRTHPLTYERIADMQNRLAGMPYRQHADSQEFTFVKARIEASEGDAFDAMRKFEARAKNSPSLGAWYGLARAALRANDPRRAREAFHQLELMGAGNSPLATMLNAEIMQAEKRPNDAIALLGGSLDRDSGYRPLVYQYAQYLLLANRAKEALAFLTDQQRIWQSDARLRALQAQAYQALGRPAQAHLAQAESYALLDKTSAAIEQLQLAQKSGNADFYTLSIIDARLRQLKQKHLSEQEK